MDIALHNVSYDYPLGEQLRPALQDISLQIRAHEIVAIVGPSGCGKSTLLNLIGGFLAPTQGTVLMRGKPITGPGADRIMIFQQSALFPFYTVAENIEYGLRLRGVAAGERRAQAKQMLASIHLAAFADALPRELSEGMRKLVEIGRALILSAPVLVFDESLGSLDALKRRQMQQLIQSIHQQHRPTVVWVTHDVEEAVMLADRVVVMSQRPGRIVEVVEVALPRPRSEATRTSAPLQAIRQRVFDSLTASTPTSEVDV